LFFPHCPVARIGAALQALTLLFLPWGEPTGHQVQQAGVELLERGGVGLQAAGVFQGIGIAAGPLQPVLDRGLGLPAAATREAEAEGGAHQVAAHHGEKHPAAQGDGGGEGHQPQPAALLGDGFLPGASGKGLQQTLEHRIEAGRHAFAVGLPQVLVQPLPP
jgi:hypothetical protein